VCECVRLGVSVCDTLRLTQMNMNAGTGDSRGRKRELRNGKEEEGNIALNKI